MKTQTFTFLLALLFSCSMNAQPLYAPEDFRLAGDARHSGGNCLQLTPDEQWSAGSIWYRKALSLSEPFEMDLKLMLGCKDDAGADGMVFVFHPHAERNGYRGEGMGFAGLVPSLGVEIDTWQNHHLGDPAQDHIALLRDGHVHHAYSLAGPKIIPNVEDCREHTLYIRWTPGNQLFTVYLDKRLVISYKSDIVQKIFGGNDKVYWGITAATGRYSNRQAVCLEKLEYTLAEERKPLELTGPKAKQLLDGEFISIDRVQFESGSAKLLPEAKQELRALASIMKANPKLKLDILGHTDNVGSAANNQSLSERRSAEVARYLREQGIPEKRLAPRGLGEKHPKHSNDTTEGRQRNRRVEFRLSLPRV